jgi:rsbT co-antagonist protein RsbR
MNSPLLNSRYISAFKEWKQQKEFLNFTKDDENALQQMQPLAMRYADEFIDLLYEHLLAFPETKRFFSDERKLNHVKLAQKSYFLDLFAGEYGEDYFNSRIKVGMIHQRIGLPPRLYMNTYCYYLQLLIPQIYGNPDFNPETANNVFMALYKLICLDQELALSAYIHATEEVISRQSEEIMEMSTPVIQVWEGVVAAPIIGTLDSSRTQQFMERLLETIVATNSPVALVDITGVPQIDTATAQHLIDTINAVKLLGSQVIITGVRPAIAQTLVHLGIDLTDIITRPSMAAGLKVALDKLSIKVIKTEQGV